MKGTEASCVKVLDGIIPVAEPELVPSLASPSTRYQILGVEERLN